MARLPFCCNRYDSLYYCCSLQQTNNFERETKSWISAATLFESIDDLRGLGFAAVAGPRAFSLALLEA